MRAPWVLAALLAFAGRAAAQDFSPATGAGPAAGAAALLDRALGAPEAGAAIECGAARRFAMTGLESRALAATLSRGSVRFAAGVAQTGEPEFGWNAAAVALGSAHASGGVALRALARRERRSGALAMQGLREGAGLERVDHLEDAGVDPLVVPKVTLSGRIAERLDADEGQRGRARGVAAEVRPCHRLNRFAILIEQFERDEGSLCDASIHSNDFWIGWSCDNTLDNTGARGIPFHPWEGDASNRLSVVCPNNHAHGRLDNSCGYAKSKMDVITGQDFLAFP